MKNAILCMSFIFATIFGKAQTISGYIFTETDHTPVEFASVVLEKLPDSTFQAGAISYTGGIYTFNNVSSGSYLIKTSSVGLQDGFATIQVTVEKEAWIVDTIFVSTKSTGIDEVAVTADRLNGQELIDRTVYAVPEAVVKASTDAYDLLRKIPSVQVDFNNNMTLNGKSNFIIQIDGKQRDKDFLNRIVPEDIETIEIIHNPSGKYDGTIDGVINVKLKPGARAGISGNAMAMVRPAKKPTIFGNLGLDYGRNKTSFYISGYSFLQELVNTTSSKKAFTINSAIDSVIDNTGDGDFKISASSLNTGLDYYINKKNNLSFNVTYKPTSLINNLENTDQIISADTSFNQQSYLTQNDTRSHETNTSLFYKKEFKKPIQELTIESILYVFNSTNNNDFSTHMPENDSLIRSEHIASNRNYLQTKIDYVQPLGVSMRLEGGYQIFAQQMFYDFDYNDTKLSNEYRYDEFRHALYLGWTGNISKFGLQFNLRTEYSDIEINDTADSKYVTFLPSANIQYKISGRQNLKLTYNKRIRRPGVYELNPFEKINNDLTVSKGNPYLKPVYRNKVQLTYTFNFDKNNIAPYIYYEHISNKISTKYTLGSSTASGVQTIISNPENLLSGNEKCFGLNAQLWFFNINGNIFHRDYDEYRDPNFTIEAYDYYTYNVNSFVYFPVFKEKVNLFAFVRFEGVRIEGESKIYSSPMYGYGGQIKLKDHSIGAFVFLPFASDFRVNKTTTETPYFKSESYSSFNVAQYIQVQYAYKFNKGKSVKKMNRKAEVESDTKGGGIGR